MATGCHVQKLYVMRHAQRWDDAHREWVQEPGVRTWDPPLTDAGFEQAQSAGEKMRSEVVRIDRIFVSPFLRCVQTAAGFIRGMFPEGSDVSGLKVCIEFGLSELINSRAIWYPPADPRNGEAWTLPVDRLVSELPSGVVDLSVQPVVPKLPDWEETREEGSIRYMKTIYTAADKFPLENILYISHGEAVKVSFKDQNPGILVNNVYYCAYTEVEREIFIESPLKTGSWKMLTEFGQKSGLMFKERLATSFVRPSIGNKNEGGEEVSQNVVHTSVANMETLLEVETRA